jgi:DNA-binding response OmpR family regulator
VAGLNQDGELVLVVDDEPDVADTYSLRLAGEYDTRVAYGGEEALEKVDEDVGAVLLDRRMPDIHGDDVLDEIRERGYDCVVIMLTAVDPDLNILEMEFDDYLCKPAERETLLETLDSHLEQPTPSQEEEEDTVSEFLSLVAKLDVLENEMSHAERSESQEYQEMKERAEELGPEVRKEVDDLDDLIETHRSIARGQ